MHTNFFFTRRPRLVRGSSIKKSRQIKCITLLKHTGSRGQAAGRQFWKNILMKIKYLIPFILLFTFFGFLARELFFAKPYDVALCPDW